MNIDLNIQAPDFENYNSNSLYQFIEFGKFCLNAAVFNPQQNVFIALKKIVFNEEITQLQINTLTEALPEIENMFAKRILLFQQRKFTLLPEEFYENDIEKKVLGLNYKLRDDENCYKDYIDKLNAYLLSAISKKTENLIELVHYDALFNSVKPYLKSIYKIKPDSFNKSIFLQINDDFIILIVRDNNGGFQLINSFATKGDEDIFYHLMNVVKQTGCNPDKDSLYISGNYEKKSTLFQLVFKYIRYPFTQKMPENIGLHPVFENFFTHPYHNLFSTALCV